MDNKVYFDILNGLKEYNKSLSENYGNAIYSLPPKLDKDQNLKLLKKSVMNLPKEP